MKPEIKAAIEVAFEVNSEVFCSVEKTVDYMMVFFEAIHVTGQMTILEYKKSLDDLFEWKHNKQQED